MNIVLPRGRLMDKSLKLLSKVDMEITRPQDRELVSVNNGHKALSAKAFDVPVYVEEGADIGITGKDVVEERGNDIFVPLSLPFGKCRLSLALPKDNEIEPEDMDGYKVATEYPNISENFFRSLGVQVETLTVKGSTELAPRAGIADAIVDIVQTGNTLEANGLKEVRKIMEVSALFLVNRISQKTKFEEINRLISRLREVIRGES